MSASKRNAILTKFGDNIGTIKRLKSGRVRTLRGRPKVTDHFKEGTALGAEGGLNAPTSQTGTGGSGRSSMKNIFPQLANATTEYSNLSTFPKANAAYQSVFDSKSLHSQMDQIYVAEASINISNNAPQEPKLVKNPSKVDDEALQTTTSIFNFLWDPKVDEPKKAVFKQGPDDNVIEKF